MPRKSILELVAQANADFPDNVTGLVTPAKLRQFCLDFLNAISPAYGYLSKPAPSAQTFGLTPSLVTFTAAHDSDPSQTTSAVPASTITRAERGVSTLQFSAGLETNSGRFVTFTIYKDGAPTLWRITGNGGGAGNPVSVALTAVDYADPAAVYSVKATAEVNGTSVTLSNMVLLVSVDPVRSFT